MLFILKINLLNKEVDSLSVEILIFLLIHLSHNIIPKFFLTSLYMFFYLWYECQINQYYYYIINCLNYKHNTSLYIDNDDDDWDKV